MGADLEGPVVAVNTGFHSVRQGAIGSGEQGDKV